MVGQVRNFPLDAGCSHLLTPDMTKKFALIFDLDGTLIDSNLTVAEATNIAVKGYDIPAFTSQTITKYMGGGFQKSWELLEKDYSQLLPDRDKLQPIFMEHYIALSRQSSPVFDNVEDVLQTLADQYPLALCTNKAEDPTRAVLDGLGWVHLFSAVVTAETLSVKKPDPATALHALAGTGAPTGLFVGDSNFDEQTAHHAKLPFAFFTEGYHHGLAAQITRDYSFSAWRDFPAIADKAYERASALHSS